MFRLLPILIIAILYLPSTVLADGPRVLFDQGHGQAFTIEKEGDLQLGKLARLFNEAGCDVSSTTESLSLQRLQQYDALVISGPFKPLMVDEILAVEEFLRSGGRVAVMLHVAQPLIPLLHRIGVVTATGVVREGEHEQVIGREAINFYVADLEEHPLTRGLQRFALYGGWPLLAAGEGVHSIASTSSKAWVDLNRDRKFNIGDAVQKFSLVVDGQVGKGAFVVFADDAMFQNHFLKGENERLAENLVQWLISGGANRSVII